MTTHKCELCGVALPFTKPRHLTDGTTPCFFTYHDECCFGLGYNNTTMASNKRLKKEWKYPTAEDLETNRKEIRQLKKEL
jgi:hypothetical protein